MIRNQLRSGISHVGQALQDPESFALRWHRGEVQYQWWVWGSLLATAILGTTTYGMTMGLLSNGQASDVSNIFYKAIACTAAAGMAWSIALPALYILNSLSGSRLKASTTLLVALVTVSWGGLAMIASIPINWFFTVAIPNSGFVLVINLVVFTGVGIAMSDVFRRVMQRLEPQRTVPPTWWLALLAVIGGELFFFFDLFVF